MNRAGLSFSLSVNHLADRSQEELAMMRGHKKTHVHRKAQPFPSEIHSIATPDSIDWRLYGVYILNLLGCMGSQNRSMHV